MATFTAEQAKDYWPLSNCNRAGEIQAIRGTYSISAALALNDVIEICKLPARHVIVDAILDTDDLDTNGTPLITLSVGTATTANLLINASTIGRTGGIARMDQAGGARLAEADTDTVIRITVAAAPATGAASGTIGLTLFYRAAQGNE